jgi:hypothetical protein
MQVADRLELAADVFARLPGVRPQGYFTAWPEYFHSFGDQVGQEPKMRRPRPSPRDITGAEEALLWLRWLEHDDARIVWLRANGTPVLVAYKRDILAGGVRGTVRAAGCGGARGCCVVLRVPSCRRGMLGGAARNIASDRAIFLGSHPAWSPPHEARITTQ